MYGAADAIGVLGAAGTGVVGQATDPKYGIGVMGIGGSSLPTGLAGMFLGEVVVTQGVFKGGGGFRIDHPTDPASRFLNHSFVESDEMKNVYDGEVKLNRRGEARVKLPSWFDAINRSFRYQLTPIGAPCPDLHVAREIRKGTFAIAGGVPGAKVCWQVTGVRCDRWANRHRIRVEERKTGRLRGRYLHPELFGKGASASIASTMVPGFTPRDEEQPTTSGSIPGRTRTNPDPPDGRMEPRRPNRQRPRRR
jgi:hypothetical protein